MRRSVWIMLFVLFIYLLSYAGVVHSIDELATLSVAESFLHKTIQVNHMEWEQERYPPQNAFGPDGNLYSKKGLGTVLLVLPLLWMGKMWSAVGAGQLTFLSSAIIVALTVSLFFPLARLLDYESATSTLAALALGLGTLLWPYARFLFGEPLAACGVCLALIGLVLVYRGSEEGGLPLCSLGGGLMVWARTANAVIFLPFLLAVGYCLFSAWQRDHQWRQVLRRGALFAAPLLLMGSTAVLYNYACFGTFVSFPLVAGEAFTTPLWEGVSGQLWSPGKGLLWYVPLTFLVIVSYLVAWRTMISLPYLAALGAVLAPLLFYGRWYDWPGGLAWGPRFLVPAMPAVVMLSLPAIRHLYQSPQRWQRWFLYGWLGLSLLAQLPGVLINFEYQSILDGKAGISFADTIWQWQFSPLVTYGNKVFTGSADILWFHSFFWHNASWLLGFLALVCCLLMGMHLYLWRRTQKMPAQPPSWVSLLILGLGTAVFALALVASARLDPRWHEETEAFEANEQVRDWVTHEAIPSDIVLLDLRADGYDTPGRVKEWANFAPLAPDYIGWRRKALLQPSDQARLQNWLKPYGRVWLILQATGEAAPESTTENWLRSWAYEGQNQWVGAQRIVEYVLPDTAQTPLASGTAVFQTEPPLEVQYSLTHAATSAHLLLDFTWHGGRDGLKYSVQVLDLEQGQLLQQVDRTISNDDTEKVGLVVPDTSAIVVLKVYDPAVQLLYPIVTASGNTNDYLLLMPAPNP